MARPLRIEYAGAFYHVLSRGNAGERIFKDHRDRLTFLDIIEDASERFSLDVFAYVLMDNHYHLLFRTHRNNLSKAMQWLGTTYTRRFNNRHHRSGHLFQGRFKSILIENESYLMRLSCYIHRNPLRAKMVKRLIEYTWSSYPAYAYGKHVPEWLDMSLILNRSNAKDKHKAYREKVQRYAEEEEARLWEDFRHGFIIGTAEFVKRLRTSRIPEEPDRDIPQQRSIHRFVDPMTLLNKWSPVVDVDIHDLRNAVRVAKADKDHRDLLIYLLWDTGWFTNYQIGNILNLAYSTVSQIVGQVRRRLPENAELRRRIEKIKAISKV